MNYQILLYYYYGHLPDAADLVAAQKTLAQQLGLKGRVIIAAEGMNGTLEGTGEATEAFVTALTSDERFAGIHMKRSQGTGDAFRKLTIKLRDEIVSAHLGEADINPAAYTAPYLMAEELHTWIHSDKEFYIVDMRNDYEHASGHFKNSILPELTHFRDLPRAVAKLEHLKGKVVVTVCTGGVRCEKASGYLLEHGFAEVYQLFGGIVTYMEAYPNEDFLGKLYVFDKRIVMGFNTDSPTHQVIGRCEVCGKTSEHYVNNDADPKRRHFICCEACAAKNPDYVPARMVAKAAA